MYFPQGLWVLSVILLTIPKCFAELGLNDTNNLNTSETGELEAWASCPTGKIACAHAPGMPGTFSPPPRVSDPDMHHGTCVTPVPWCMPGSLNSGFLWSRRRGKTFPAFPAHAILQFYQSGKRPMEAYHMTRENTLDTHLRALQVIIGWKTILWYDKPLRTQWPFT